ncbi:hypothetical protein RNI52_32505 [Labrys neptuniae]|uniref:Polysaccharide biosynthesis enzyme WcbI domain-containing protein n=1 Tax=Labrys neptuniae TaxID=376174 RepID=A0ABV3PXB6_9HYPH|nr:hypothetical protein [Labrys neptuniae]MDT3382093.1 hypothetical protein [Labrys neptuniae]
MKVFVLGSCRLHRPMEEIAATGRCSHYDGGSRAYLHSVGEAVQRLRWMRGECQIPDGMAPYVFSTERVPRLSANAQKEQAKADFLLVEVASEKELICDGIYLQLNYLHRHLLSPLGEGGKLWWKEMLQKRCISAETAKKVIASEQFAEAGFGEADARILRNARCELADEDALRQGLIELKQLWGKPMAAVSHVGLPLQDGRVLQSRETFIARVKKIGAELGIPVFEPRGVIEAVGRTRALERQGADLDHYDPGFEQMYGWYLLNRVIKPNASVIPDLAA